MAGLGRVRRDTRRVHHRGARAARRQELAERQARLAAGGERAGDRGGLVGLLALGAVYARLTTDEAPPDRRLVRQLLELHEQARRGRYRSAVSPEHPALAQSGDRGCSSGPSG